MIRKGLLDRLRRQYRGYSGARPDVMRLIPRVPARVLDVGCGAGISADLLREAYPDVYVAGVEPDPNLARLARTRMNVVTEAAIDDYGVIDALRCEQPFDLIFCADVLEHLRDPWQVLKDLAGCMAPDGSLITSVPNIRHISTFLSLGLLGDWPRRARGIHDGTHLRFFARKNILTLGAEAGLMVVREERNLRIIESAPWTSVPAKVLDFWPLRGFMTFQYLHLWRSRNG